MSFNIAELRMIYFLESAISDLCYVCCLQLKLAVDKGHAVENVYMGKSIVYWWVEITDIKTTKGCTGHFRKIYSSGDCHLLNLMTFKLQLDCVKQK